MMYDFRVFNAEICDLPGNTEERFEVAAAENFDAESFVEELTRSPSISRSTSEPSTPIKKGYEANPDSEESEAVEEEEEEEEEDSLVLDEDSPPAKRIKCGTFTVVNSLDFTTGCNCLHKIFIVTDQMTCHVVRKVVREQQPFKH